MADAKQLFSELRDVILKDDDIYKGFIASIESALIEVPNYMKIPEMAKYIADRIIGKEIRHETD